MEIWKDIPNIASYEISNLGRIRNKVTGVVRSPKIGRGGYAVFQHKINKKSKSYFVHRLVLLAFVGDLPDGMEVNHKNAIRNDNRLDNLEYVTRSQNQLHRSRVLHNFNGAKTPHAKLTDEKVVSIRLLYMEGMTAKEIATRFDVSAMTIWWILTGKTWYHVPFPDGFVLRDDRGVEKKTTKDQDEKMVSMYQTGNYSIQELSGIFGLSKSAIVKRVCNKSEKRKGWKLTRSQQEELVKLYKTGEYTQRQLSEMFKTSTGNVSKLIKRLS